MITVPFTFVATVAAIEYAGARPVLVDIEPGYYTMDPAALERAITPRTRAIVPVHLYGQPADMDAIVGIARRHGIAVIEDACQAHGSEYRGQRAGSIGDIGCFSFYPGKNLGAYGEGGAAVTRNPEYAETMRLLRSWGEKTRYEHRLKAFNYRMDGLQGAILGVKLKHLERWTGARRDHAGTYGRLLAGTAVRTPVERPGVRHVYHVYTVRLQNRDAWRRHLTDLGIQTAIHYPILLSKDAETGTFYCGVMLGFDAGENLFLSDGKGHDGYRPLNLQRGPFYTAGSELAIDLDHPRISESEGQALFGENGVLVTFEEPPRDNRRVGARARVRHALGAQLRAARRIADQLAQPLAKVHPVWQVCQRIV